MTGTGRSYGAISVLNAIPCGIGSTIGVDLCTEAVFEPSDKTNITLVDRPGMNKRLVKVCVTEALKAIGENPEIRYKLTVKSDIPPSRGLKSSSSVCNAVISSVLDHFKKEMDPLDVIRLGVECAIKCKVTITGAFDDACGCHLGGLVVTDNAKRELISRKELPKYDVLICSPEEYITKDKVDVSKYRELKNAFQKLAHLIDTDPLTVLTRNGRAVAKIIGMDDSLCEKAISRGALAAGVSGTGPAIAIVCEPGKGNDIADGLDCPVIRCRVR